MECVRTKDKIIDDDDDDKSLIMGLDTLWAYTYCRRGRRRSSSYSPWKEKKGKKHFLERGSRERKKPIIEMDRFKVTTNRIPSVIKQGSIDLSLVYP